MTKSQSYETVKLYHEKTKHRLDRYAAGPATLDWDAQPNPFREFANTHIIDLPLFANEINSSYADIYQPGTIQPQPITLKTIGAFFELALGLSAWKVYGKDRWSLRCNPSSGNLHPTEAYAVLTDIPEINNGVFHYHSLDHVLEQRCILTDPHTSDALIPAGSFLIGLSSIHWREAWKYGERAFRYCQLDTGHAIASIRYAAATLGWHVRMLNQWSDQEIAQLLGLDRQGDFRDAELEHPEVMLQVQTPIHTQTQANTQSDIDLPDTRALLQAVHEGEWQGQANILDPKHLYQWPIIDEVSMATDKPRTTEISPLTPSLESTPLIAEPNVTTASQLIRQRRSAQAFDGTSSLPLPAFLRMLDLTLPRKNTPPWDCWPVAPRIDLILFIHRVDGLKPGLYTFVRQPDKVSQLRNSLRQNFEWLRPDDCPENLNLFRLVGANSRKAAATVACHQAIGGNSAFSLGMLGEFDNILRDSPWEYKRLFWEAGIIGQILYLEAEAANVRGTGIGCFFDDALHELIGLSSNAFQDLYHFTVGTPVVDDRLITLSPYHHLQNRK